ncbi:uncharacterized protein [Miscanthus floridulus]|uniref:uncharacterized protein n=1 Tax=Miscanthus floridulus TaxID=154761 RepID=UPI00345A455B
MDGGSGLNIMYAKTLDKMGVDWTRLHPTRAPFHGIMPRKQALPLRTETLTFEVVGFPETFHTILGHPCYMKFMAIPNYTYLKLKMSGPHEVIIVSTTFHHAYECEVKCCSHATAIVASGKLAALKEEVAKEALDAKKLTKLFELVEGSKKVLVDPSSSEGKMNIGATYQRCMLKCFGDLIGRTVEAYVDDIAVKSK